MMEAPTHISKKYLKRAEASEYLERQGITVAAGTLQKLACVGGGPAYRVIGRNALYTPADLEAWIAGHESRQSATG